MINELIALKVQIEIEMKFHGKDGEVTVTYNEETGKYVNHYIKYDTTRTVPNIIQQMSLGLKLHYCSFEELYNAVMSEINNRIEIEQG